MKCPLCEVELKLTERQGIEIDYCPTCRGIWLDRGELDRLIERSYSNGSIQGDTPSRDRQQPRRSDEYDRRKKKKSSWLGELLDFD